MPSSQAGTKTIGHSSPFAAWQVEIVTFCSLRKEVVSAESGAAQALKPHLELRIAFRLLRVRVGREHGRREKHFERRRFGVSSALRSESAGGRRISGMSYDAFGRADARHVDLFLVFLVLGVVREKEVLVLLLRLLTARLDLDLVELLRSGLVAIRSGREIGRRRVLFGDRCRVGLRARAMSALFRQTRVRRVLTLSSMMFSQRSAAS